ncbi:basic proline-rich protein [Sorghum bicolor]|uniref:basic proline-rich protein n=1 Tax=Sorghum bicolor TaxID=4558 RepID=UPI000B424287|nr:basic proline-rich protein [Sorghum bicolor]|eukprot:XP_002440449.2 basic proline-rich protein [Sorghum bicolor]
MENQKFSMYRARFSLPSLSFPSRRRLLPAAGWPACASAMAAPPPFPASYSFPPLASPASAPPQGGAPAPGGRPPAADLYAPGAARPPGALPAAARRPPASAPPQGGAHAPGGRPLGVAPRDAPARPPAAATPGLYAPEPGAGARPPGGAPARPQGAAPPSAAAASLLLAAAAVLPPPSLRAGAAPGAASPGASAGLARPPGAPLPGAAANALATALDAARAERGLGGPPDVCPGLSAPLPGAAAAARIAAWTTPPLPSSPLGPPPSEPSEGGGGGRSGSHRRRRGNSEPHPPAAVLTGAPPGARPVGGDPAAWASFHNPWSRAMLPLQAPGGATPRPATAMLACAPPGSLSASPGAPPPAVLPRPVGWGPTALANCFSAMTPTPPVGPYWVADSGATYHTTPDPSILSSVHPPSSHPSSIMVANGSCLLVTSVGAAGAHGSFRLPDVLVAPSMVHNLLSIRRFTADNSCSVEFDSSGLTFSLTIKAVQCDNGREFDNSTSRAFFLSHGVQLRMSCPYTSSQNGKAERMIRTTNDTIRTLLLQASLPARFWAESLHTSTYLLNRLPSTACPAPTPHHALFGTPPRYDHLRVFGCACYPNTTATAPHKLAPRSTLCVFLGYSPDHKGYRCYDLTSRRVLISRHVVFDEFVFPFSTTTTPASAPDLDFFSSCPADPVAQPPLLFPAGSAPPRSSPALCPGSSPTGVARGSVPCTGPLATPLQVVPATTPDAGPGTPVSVPPAPCTQPVPVGPPARFAQPVRVYQRRARPVPPPPPPGVASTLCLSRHHRWSPLRRPRLLRHRGHRLHVLCRRCTTRRFFTATRVMSTRW